jgi:hypothetical protein
MDLRAAAIKPKLVEITLDSDYVMKEYGEPLTFYMWDRQSMPVYIHLSTLDKSDMRGMLEAIRDLVLDRSGEKMLSDGVELPPNVMIDVINRVVDQLGNSVGQTLTA